MNAQFDPEIAAILEKSNSVSGKNPLSLFVIVLCSNLNISV